MFHPPHVTKYGFEVEGIKAGILLKIIQCEAEKNPSSQNLYVFSICTNEKDCCYEVGFSTTFQAMSGMAYVNQYKIENGECVFVKNISISRS